MRTINLHSCLLLLQAFIYIQSAGSGPVIEVSPNEINLGLTTSFEVNCSFAVDSASDLAALISLTVSRSNDSGQTFTEVASITEFKPTTVNLATSENIQADGLVNEAGESYIHLMWEHPAAHQGGLYQCASQGIDLFGHNIVMTSSSQVFVDEPNANEFTEKLRELENYTKSLEATISQLNIYTGHLEDKIKSERDNCTGSLQEMMVEIHNLTAALEQNSLILRSFLEIPITYSGSKYYLCKDGTYTSQTSMDMCRGIGGYLLEIDTAGEFQAIQGYLNTTTGFRFVLTAGSDESSEGTWVFPSTNQSLPYVNWAPGNPQITTGQNCILMGHDVGWQMLDEPCKWAFLRSDIRYICEVSDT